MNKNMCHVCFEDEPDGVRHIDARRLADPLPNGSGWYPVHVSCYDWLTMDVEAFRRRHPDLADEVE